MDLTYLGIAFAFFGACFGMVSLFTHLLESRS
jgi:hypothetical protein